MDKFKYHCPALKANESNGVTKRTGVCKSRFVILCLSSYNRRQIVETLYLNRATSENRTSESPVPSIQSWGVCCFL